MNKIKTGLKLPTLPLPICLAGAHVNSKPNFNTIAWFNMLDSNPPLIGMAMSKKHYSNKGIKENKSFSINIPSANMVKVTDYCGLISGADVDKSNLFNIFYGQLKTAPMIEECCLNIECKLKDVKQFERTEFFIGEIVEIYTEEKYLTDKQPDFKKMNPFIFLMPNGPYLKLGDFLAKAYEVGKNYKPN